MIKAPFIIKTRHIKKQPLRLLFYVLFSVSSSSRWRSERTVPEALNHYRHPHAGEELYQAGKRGGADSFWHKEVSPEELITVMDATMQGKHMWPGESPIVKLGVTTSKELTDAQLKVLRLICDGLEYDEIAGRLDVAERTVKYHVSNILSKTGYANRTRLAIAVTNKKFIVPNLPEEQEFSKTE